MKGSDIEARPEPTLTKKSILIFATTCGFTVASAYYLQPLFPVVGKDLHAAATQVSWVSTVLQLGYAMGLFLIVPLGDYFDRRKLIPALMVLLAIGLFGVSIAPNLSTLLFFGALVGLTAVVAQVIIGLVATVANPGQRGAAIGNAMTGLLLGLLLARTVSGLVAQYFNWRYVFVGAGIAVLALAVVVAKQVPEISRTYRGSYPQLLRSLGQTFAQERTVRRAALIGALNFACFSIFWNTSSLHLSSPPFSLDSATIGLFGLVGVAGAIAARLAGRLADSGRQVITSTIMNALVGLAFVIFLVFPQSLLATVVGVVVLDFGVQGSHISNQSVIYSVRLDARSRITSIYMTSYFVGGALGSFSSTLEYRWGGYPLVVGGGLAIAIFAILFRILSREKSPV